MPRYHHAGVLTVFLHGYWRSTASYRVRIALNLKGLAFQQSNHDLRRAEQRSDTYLAINAQGLVPTLEACGQTFLQSSAIIEWLEEQYPNVQLLPRVPADRDIVRGMAAIIGSDIHPLNNLRVLTSLRTSLGASEDDVRKWIEEWVALGFAALEVMISRYGGNFAFGGTPTIADCYLVPQVYSAERFGVDLAPYPNLMAAAEAARILQPFLDAHPNHQPDADQI